MFTLILSFYKDNNSVRYDDTKRSPSDPTASCSSYESGIMGRSREIQSWTFSEQRRVERDKAGLLYSFWSWKTVLYWWYLGHVTALALLLFPPPLLRHPLAGRSDWSTGSKWYLWSYFRSKIFSGKLNS